MPTQQEFEAWIQELAGILAGAGVPLGGEVMSLGSGAPSMVCAYLITLINQKMQRIAEDTAITGMSAAQAMAFQRLRELKRRIEAACDETEVPDTPAPPDSQPDPEPWPTPAPMTEGLPPMPQPVEPKPPSERELCCALHGHQPPLIDVSQLQVQFVSGGLTIQGSVSITHPCGIGWYQTQVFVRDAQHNQYRVDNRDHRFTTARPDKHVDLNYGGMPVRGFASAWVQVNAESVCGRRAQVIMTPFGVA